ncbi:MAG: response regulator [Anaerolineae bacterium]
MAHNGTVLIVDDLPSGRAALEGLLFDQGYELLMAENGLQALQLARTSAPDIVLLDVMMPDMDGYEVCQRLRDDPRTAQIPVVMVTALEDRMAKLRGLEVGADDFISKPFDRTELRIRVRTITQLNRYRRLLDEQAQFQWVIEQAADGYVIVDQSDRIVYANAQARLYLNLSIDLAEAADRTFFQLAAQQYRPEPSIAWIDWTSPVEPVSHTRYLVRPESSTAHACWLAVWTFNQQLRLNGQRLIRLHDVTLRMIERRHERTFQGIVAHKLRSPLASLLGSLEILAYHAQESTMVKADDMARVALRSATRMRNEIEDVLHYVSAAKLAAHGEPFVWAQLPDLIKQIGASLDLADVTVTIDEAAAAVATRLSDTALDWILSELLENARKFHPLQTPHVEVRFDLDDERQARLRVIDDGLTLSPEQLAQVWEPYYQGEKYFTGEAAGMGLGLSLVASLVWEANGTCQLRNRTDGAGVMVQITLPIIEPEPDSTHLNIGCHHEIERPVVRA